MSIFTRTAARLQACLTTHAQKIGDEHQLVRRQRQFSASSLLATFVLGFLQHPQPTWEQLAFLARQLQAHVTPQAVLARVTPALRDSLQQLWLSVCQELFAAPPRDTPLLRKFTHILIGDSTTIRLADALAEEFPGCGGAQGSGRAAMKLQVVWDWLSGRWWHVSCEAGKENDSTSLERMPTPPAGSLLVFDLGYFLLARFERWQAANIHWISRGISDLLVWTEGSSCDLLTWLTQQPKHGPIDRWVEVGAQRLPCRLLALRAPPEVAARRRRQAHEKARKKSRQPTARHLASCDWTVYLTSCAEDLLCWQEVVVLYRLRWQIELLFKLWKSHGHLAAHRSSDPVRQLVELYARLIAIVLQHWLVLTTCWPDAALSLVRVTRLIRGQSPQLVAGLLGHLDLAGLLSNWSDWLGSLTRVSRRRTSPSNAQLLANPSLLTFTA